MNNAIPFPGKNETERKTMRRKECGNYEYVDFIAFVVCMSRGDCCMHIIKMSLFRCEVAASIMEVRNNHSFQKGKEKISQKTLFLSCRHNHSVSRNF